MNAIVQFNPSKVPAFAKNAELSETAKALAGSAPGGKRISIKGGVFRLLDGGKEIAAIDERYLDVVLVKAATKINRVFYAGKYNPEESAPPTCWSADGDRPSPDAQEQQSETCANCAKNVAGSGEGNSRACRYQQRTAVALATDLESGAHSLTVPAASLFGKAEGDNRPLQEYARWLAAQKINPETVVTRLKFDTSAESPKLFFKAMRWLTDDEFETVEQIAQSKEAQDAVTVSFSKREAAGAPPEFAGQPPKAKAKAKAAPAPAEDDDEPAPPPKAKAKAAPATAPAEDDEDAPPPPPKAKAKAAPAPAEDDAEEPTVRKEAAKKPPVSGKPDLAQAISDWDDD
jgi:hypothetical protein